MAKVLTNLVFKSSTPILDDEADFPGSPEFGQFCFKGGVLYIYASIDNTDTWYPLTNRNQYAVHTQALSATAWTVGHNLSTEDVIFMVYDDSDTQIIPSSVVFDSENQITLNFVEATAGKAVVFGASEQFTPAVHTSTINVGSQITMSGTSIVVGGTDIVQLLDQTQSDLNAMFSWNETQGEITFKGDLIPETNDSLSIGSATKKIKDLFVSAQTVYVGDNATFEGTSLSIDAGANPTAASDAPTLLASSLVLRPFTYNPGGGDVNVEPVLKFQNLGGQQYGISFNLIDNEFQLDSPAGVGTGSIKAQTLTVNDKITADTIETTGTAQVKFDQGLRVDGDVNLGYDQGNTIAIKGTVDLQTPITFSEAATLGDGNDNIAVNCGAANDFTVNAQNVSINAAGKVTAAEMESTGDLTVQGDLFVNGTQTVVDTTSLTVTDNEVVINNGEAGAGITAGTGGIRVDRGSLPDALLQYDDSTDKWMIGIDGSMSEFSVSGHDHDTRYLRANADSQPDVDNVHDLGASGFRFQNAYAATFHGALNGVAAEATALETSRSISLSGDVSGSASFDGTGDANITATVANDSHTHDGRYYTESEQDTRFLRRDANGTPDVDLTYNLGDATHRWNNVYAQNFTGEAATAAKWTNSRTVTLSGDISGSFDIDGSGNANCTVTVADDSHNHNTQYYTKTESNNLYANVAGDTFTGHLKVNDNVYLQAGDGGDLYMHHDGTHSYIRNKTGTLYVMVNDGESALAAVPNSYTYLYYDNAWRIRTTSAGVEINGVMAGQASSALYADLAEKLTCAEPDLPVGTVLKACETGSYDVEQCNSERATNVLGVVSDNPAYLMNAEEDGIAVGYTGKVQVRMVGPVGKGAAIVPAGDGLARGIKQDSELLYSFGVTLEEHASEEESLVWCIIK